MPFSALVDEPLTELLRKVDPAQELGACGLRELVIGPEAVERVAETVLRLLPDVGDHGHARVCLLVDATRIRRDGEDVKDAAERELARHFTVTRHVLDDGHPQLHVTDRVLEGARAAAAGADVVVALGAGTISDIGKVAAMGAEGARPLLVTVQTAASVDGFTDNVSVILRDGVKRTVPTRWPDAVVADRATVAAAPAGMNRAGFGEMTSMLVAPADWRLAQLVGTDPAFRRPAIALLELVGRDIEEWASGVRTGEPDAVESLTRALALRGVVTGVAGTTAVLSGMEHLVSHMLDQYHGQAGLPVGLHGAQVGVAAVVAAAAWEMLFERMSNAPAALVPIERLQELGKRQVADAFGQMGDGRIALECWNDYSRKLAALAEGGDRLRGIVDGWSTHESELRGLLRPSANIAAWLRAAGAPATFAELDPAISPELTRWAVANCALMRNRFTVVDLLTALGWWEPDDVDQLLAKADAAARATAEGR